MIERAGILGAIERLYLAGATLCALALPLVVAVGVAFRYFLRRPLSGIDEVATLAFIWMTFLGGAVLYGRHRHITVDFFTERLSSLWKARMRRFVTVLNLFILIALLISVWQVYPNHRFFSTVVLGIPRTLFSLPFLLALAYMILITVIDLGWGKWLNAGE